MKRLLYLVAVVGLSLSCYESAPPGTVPTLPEPPAPLPEPEPEPPTAEPEPEPDAFQNVRAGLPEGHQIEVFWDYVGHNYVQIGVFAEGKEPELFSAPGTSWTYSATEAGTFWFRVREIAFYLIGSPVQGDWSAPTDPVELEAPPVPPKPLGGGGGGGGGSAVVGGGEQQTTPEDSCSVPAGATVVWEGEIDIGDGGTCYQIAWTIGNSGDSCCCSNEKREAVQCLTGS